VRRENVKVTHQNTAGGHMHCVGRSLGAVRIYYLARSEYVGTDEFHYTVRYPQGPLPVAVHVTVKASDPTRRGAGRPDIPLPKPETRQSPGLIPPCTELVS
jgi:hypothetical protein